MTNDQIITALRAALLAGDYGIRALCMLAELNDRNVAIPADIVDAIES